MTRKRKHPETKIRRMRIRMGLLQVEAAERAGVTQAAFSNWERHGLFDSLRAGKLAEVLCCKPEELLEFQTPSRA